MTTIRLRVRDVLYVLACFVASEAFLPAISADDEQAVNQGSLAWYAQRAIHQGEKAILVPSGAGIPVDLKTVDEALRGYMVATVTPELRRVASDDEYHIYTWYKARVLEVLRRQDLNPEVDAATVPDGVGTLRSDQIAFRIVGGTLVLNGINLRMEYSPIPELKLGERYLVFFQPTARADYGDLRLGKNAVFRFSDLDHIEPISNSTSLFQLDIARRTGGKISSLRDLANHPSN